MRVCAVVNDTYEPKGAGWSYPVVRHVFYGRTCKEAEGYSRAHRGTDRFYRACNETGRFESIDCPSFYMHKWTAAPIPAPSVELRGLELTSRTGIAVVAAAALVAAGAIYLTARGRSR